MNLRAGDLGQRAAGSSRRISVVIPAYNAAGTVAACLASVYRSEHADMEVVVVDDGSTDGSGAIAGGFPCRVVHLERNQGPAAARNHGAAETSGEILFFLDADIVVEPDTLSRINAVLDGNPDVSALFCSYQPSTVPGSFVTDYKNFLHHFTHQISREDAKTFCGGFGAVRRAVFAELNGFDPGCRYVEDIELGYRMHRAGHRVRLAKEIQVTHLKRYTLASLVRSDVVGRAIPWTRIMLEKRIWQNDLNTRGHNVASVALALLAPACGPLAWFHPAVAAVLLASIGAGLAVLNRRFLAFVFRRRGIVFTAAAFAMLWLGYFYSGVGLAVGAALHLRDRSLIAS